MNRLDTVARLTERMEELERRVSALEKPSATVAVDSPKLKSSNGPQPSTEAFPFALDGGMFPVLGKAMLGIAGAYLLRAVAELGSFPKLAVVALALVYAGMWLVGAALGPIGAGFASTVYAATAALIIAPMLWELTLRFHVLATSVTAGVLSVFVVTAYALAWRRSLIAVVWVTNIAAILTSLGLLMATHDLVPFVAGLLFMALISEGAAVRSRWLSLRPVVALAADLAVWILLYIYSRPEGIPAGYKNVATPVLVGTGCALFLIYGVNVALRTMRLRQKISVFEIGQTVIAFLLGAFSILRFGGSSSSPLLGALCLLFSGAGYAVACGYFDHFPERRNYHAYITWSAALFLGGGALCLQPLLLVLCLSSAALVAAFFGMRASGPILQFHSLIYLAAAAYASGLLDYMGHALAGMFPPAPGWVVWIVAATAIACYVIGGRFPTKGWNRRFLQSLSAMLAVAVSITFLVSVLVWLAAFETITGTSRVAVIRTLIICLCALLLAFAGCRWRKSELVWIAYGTLASVTAKLIFEDLQHGTPGSIAVSIFLYAGALILVPRLTRARRRLI
jgi:hypothetical protein